MAKAALKLKDVRLEDKFELEDGTAYMSGLQALARIPIVQRRHDIAAGINTGGFISGYRGSPLGAFDRELARAQKYYNDLDVKFLPGVNEDLAATAVWGTQQVGLLPGAQKDGVFGIWYGKAPGVDRSGDVMRHASANGTAPQGGVLAIVGDDHGCKSSTLSCQSDHALYAMQIPTLYPASILEFVEYGLLGIAMSRFSGCWTALKVTTATVETSGTIDLERENHKILLPGDDEFVPPPGGLHIRLNDTPRDIDWRLQNYKLFACHAFARKNKIDRIVMDSPKPRFGIVTSGKSYGDVRQALIELGITDEVAKDIGLRVYKVGMTWPIEPQGLKAAVEGLEEVLVVEEKREFIEYQLKQYVYNWDKRPKVIVGKYDEKQQHLLPLENDHTVGKVTHVIAQRINRFYHNEQVEKALEFYEAYDKREKGYLPPSLRKPYYCSGCPHNTSTKVPDGSFAMVGIGCHYMVQWMDRNSALCTQMGGEGVPWVGAAPFSETKHIFANLGDGTYFHSGTLAIRQTVAAKTNITFKILYNDAVAMTGGQAVDGEMPVFRVAQQVMAEGVSKCWIVSERPELYKDRHGLPADVPVLHRKWMDTIQKEARETPGTTIIIYDQTCAAEKRRRRKRGKYPDPAKRVFINKSVCEGCGDCSVQSNCMAVQPEKTEYGRKRKINQSMCNKDFSCLKGFCPSFVTVYGGELRKTKASGVDDVLAAVPDIDVPELTGDAYNIMVTGIGGTGVLTVGALMGMASHLEGKHCRILDQTGLAQKGGEVLSHVRIAHDREEMRTGHIITGGSDLLLACDIVAAVGKTAHETLNPERTRAVINTNNTPVAEFVLHNDSDFHDAQIKETLMKSTLEGGQHFVPATSYALTLLGDEIATNIFMLGYAWQMGLVPLHRESLERAIELNGVAIEANRKSFAFGRLAAHDPGKLEAMAAEVRGDADVEKVAETLDDIIARRAAYLTAYQDEAYAKRYTDKIAQIRDAEQKIVANSTVLTEAAARYYHKLLAYKDEYEVARLYTDGDFIKDLEKTFQGNYKLSFHMAPPIMEGNDPATGRPKKREFGPWMIKALSVLAKLKGLRGTPLDVFGYHKERKAERALIASYEQDLDFVLGHLNKENLDLCAELLSVPDDIRGYGPVKEKNMAQAQTRHDVLMKRLSSPVSNGTPEKKAA
ncbi:MAG: indolepyruvate ferredoxin oxidoreductase family protein [Rhodospirillales bacterium]|nr:indolepyruvate ferredoxin oxidoreductase family protein [Rhodospirillales bacterium]MCB9995346.1 indolepyruvate ferredoxin oxidoreductase family protein [Rhodospirillales bacterium]